MPADPATRRCAGLSALVPGAMVGADESTWLDVIHKMDEVHAQPVRDEQRRIVGTQGALCRARVSGAANPQLNPGRIKQPC
jgi:hypothetical protein